MTERQVEKITLAVIASFPTFGKGSTPVYNNPLCEALEDKPAMFAMGVDVREVIRFVLDHADGELAVPDHIERQGETKLRPGFKHSSGSDT